jgi:hypothetical protein
VKRRGQLDMAGFGLYFRRDVRFLIGRFLYDLLKKTAQKIARSVVLPVQRFILLSPFTKFYLFVDYYHFIWYILENPICKEV